MSASGPRAVVFDFDGAYGSSGTKVEHLNAIAAQLDANPGSLLVVGDGRQDFTRRWRVGARFVAAIWESLREPRA